MVEQWLQANTDSTSYPGWVRQQAGMVWHVAQSEQAGANIQPVAAPAVALLLQLLLRPPQVFCCQLQQLLL
jgi:hypothetical protein